MNQNICVMCGEPIFTEDEKMICSQCENADSNFDTSRIIVLLNKISDIPEFVNLASKCKDDVIVKSGRYASSAKSLIGLYSLDLSKPARVEFYGDVPYEVQQGMKKFIIK